MENTTKKDENEALCLEWKNGDGLRKRQVESVFIKRYWKLLRNIAFLNTNSIERREDKGDLFNEFVFALIKALNTYDINRGFNFVSWWMWRIRSATSLYHISKLSPVIINENFDEETGKRILEKTNAILLSTEDPVNDYKGNESNYRIGDTLFYEDEDFERKKMYEKIKKNIKILNKKEKMIIRKILDGSTYEDSSNILKLSGERIRQIRNSAINKLKIAIKEDSTVFKFFLKARL